MIPPTGAAVLSATVAMVSFQIGATFAKQLIPAIGAPGTTALRLGLSALLLVVLQRPWRSVPSRSAWPVVLAYGVSLGAMNSVFYLALRTHSARHRRGHRVRRPAGGRRVCLATTARLPVGGAGGDRIVAAAADHAAAARRSTRSAFSTRSRPASAGRSTSSSVRRPDRRRVQARRRGA